MIKKIKYFIYFQFICIIQSQFGQNIVQYDIFNWNFIQSKHFDIYYSDDGKSHAEFTAEEAEIAYLKISNRLNWRLKNRVSIIVYNSHNDFQQTNVVDSYMYEGIGGVTELYKNRIVIPFDASNQEFKHVIHHELLHAFINDCVYGGSLKNMVSSAIKVQIPLWMNEGLAEYLSSGWDTNSEMWIRDMAINGGELPSLNQLTGYMAYRGGQSVWNFITDKWGDESISELLYQIKKLNNIELGFKSALGVDMKKLQEQWHKYLKKVYWPDITNRENIIDFSRRLTNHEKLENTYNVAPAISPDGSKIAIFSNKSGPMALYLISSKDGKFIKKIIQGERNAEYEELHILKPGITWSKDGKNIAFAAKSGKSDALFIVNIKSGDKKKYRLNMEGIFRPSWRPNKNEIVFVGNNGKTSDLYLFNIDNEELKNLTDDWFTDDQPSWHPDGKSIFFISDRNTVLKTGIINKPQNHDFSQTDIYEYSLLTGQIKQITNSIYNETYPCVSNNGNFLAYISDESGINNIYLKNYKFDNEDSKPITNVLTGITQLSWNGDDSQLIFTGFYNRGYDIYTLNNPIDKIVKNIKVETASWKLKKNEDMFLNNKKRNSIDDIYNKKKYQRYDFSNLVKDSIYINNEDIALDTTEYFDSTGLYQSYIYKTRFTLDFAQAYYAFDSRYGGQGMAYFLFSDILGDHKFQIGTEMVVDLQRSDYFLLYRLLPYKVDYNIAFYHLAYQYTPYNTYYIPSQSSLYQNFGLSFTASNPMNRFVRFDIGIDYNHIIKSTINTLFDENGYPYDEKIDHVKSFSTLIPSLKYIWDNAIWSYLHPIEGSRYYLKYRTSPGINEKSLLFHSATVDYRKYFRLGNAVSIAFKAFGGASWGDNAQKFRLGGVPWLFSSDPYDERYYGDQNRDLSLEELYFSEYVMPLRGTKVSNKYGKNVFLGNVELRLPFLLYYFPTIKYFGQINGVIFSDIGVTWDNEFPDFFNKNSLENNNTGWLMSYGFGPRFIFLGLPWQLDYAWEYNPNSGSISGRKWYLSIGVDY